LHAEIFGNVERKVVARWTRDGADFVRRAIAPVIGWLGNPAGFDFRPSADVGLVRAVAEAIERVFLGTRERRDEIGPVAVGTEGDQIAGVTSRTFDTMADAASHRCTGMHAVGQREYLAE